jgi:serine protease
VTGVVALMLARNAELSPAQVEQILKTSARPFPDASCDTTTCGAGIVDAERAVAIAATTEPEIPTPVEPAVGDRGGGGGGGGCALTATHRQPDPLFALLLAWSLYRLLRTQRRRAAD